MNKGREVAKTGRGQWRTCLKTRQESVADPIVAVSCSHALIGNSYSLQVHGTFLLYTEMLRSTPAQLPPLPL
jgi:hypothetical protein